MKKKRIGERKKVVSTARSSRVEFTPLDKNNSEPLYFQMQSRQDRVKVRKAGCIE